VEFCYNNSHSGTTRVSPLFVNYSYYPHFTQLLGKVTGELPEVSEYVGTLNRLHKDLRAEVYYTQTAHTEQANWYRHPDPFLGVGDQVWLK
jgi:hypothetical protein